MTLLSTTLSSLHINVTATGMITFRACDRAAGSSLAVGGLGSPSKSPCIAGARRTPLSEVATWE